MDELNSTGSLIPWITAGAAFAGALIAQLGQLFIARQNRRKEYRNFLRDRIEEVANNIFYTSVWLSEISIYIQNTTGNAIPVPKHAFRTKILADMYFPSLRESSDEFYMESVIILSELSSSLKANSSFPTSVEDRIVKLDQLKSALLDRISKEAKKLSH